VVRRNYLLKMHRGKEDFDSGLYSNELFRLSETCHLAFERYLKHMVTSSNMSDGLYVEATGRVSKLIFDVTLVPQEGSDPLAVAVPPMYGGSSYQRHIGFLEPWVGEPTRHLIKELRAELVSRASLITKRFDDTRISFADLSAIFRNSEIEVGVPFRRTIMNWLDQPVSVYRKSLSPIEVTVDLFNMIPAEEIIARKDVSSGLKLDLNTSRTKNHIVKEQPGVTGWDRPSIGEFYHDDDSVVVFAPSWRTPVVEFLKARGLSDMEVLVHHPDKHNFKRWKDADAKSTAGEGSTSGSYAHPIKPVLRKKLLEYVPERYHKLLNVTIVTPNSEAIDRNSAALTDQAFISISAFETPSEYCATCGQKSTSVFCNFCKSTSMDYYLSKNKDDSMVRQDIENVAIDALHELSNTEFGGPPSIQQILSIHSKDLRAAARALTLRWLLPWKSGGPGGWIRLLRNSGLLDVQNLDVRGRRGYQTIATDGHLARSLLERHIDDFLHFNNISHKTEPFYPRDVKLNTDGMRADWLLNDGTFVEAVGMTSIRYFDKLANKRTVAKNSGIRLIELTENDLSRLPEVFSRWLP